MEKTASNSVEDKADFFELWAKQGVQPLFTSHPCHQSARVMEHRVVIEVLNRAKWMKHRDDGSRYVDRVLFVNTLGFLFGGIKLPSLFIPGGNNRLHPNIPPAELYHLFRLGILRLTGPVGIANPHEHQSRRALLQQMPEMDLQRETRKAGKPYSDWPNKWDERIRGAVRDCLRRRVLEAGSVYETGQGFRDWGFVYWRPIKFTVMAPPNSVPLEYWSALDMEDQDGRVDRGRKQLYHPEDELALVDEYFDDVKRDSSYLQVSWKERGIKKRKMK
jgi:hypothetical protein